MRVTDDTVTIGELQVWLSSCYLGPKGQTVQLKDADPNKLQLFTEMMPASIKGKTKSMKYNFQHFFFILALEQRGTWLNL